MNIQICMVSLTITAGQGNENTNERWKKKFFLNGNHITLTSLLNLEHCSNVTFSEDKSSMTNLLKVAIVSHFFLPALYNFSIL